MRSRGSREREVILRVVFQMTEQRYTQYWVAKGMRAEASDPPASLFSYGMVQEGVRGNPGAIGYVNMSDVRSGVKVDRIGGLLPGEPCYPLRWGGEGCISRPGLDLRGPPVEHPACAR